MTLFCMRLLSTACNRILKTGITLTVMPACPVVVCGDLIPAEDGIFDRHPEFLLFHFSGFPFDFAQGGEPVEPRLGGRNDNLSGDKPKRCFA